MNAKRKILREVRTTSVDRNWIAARFPGRIRKEEGGVEAQADSSQGWGGNAKTAP